MTKRCARSSRTSSCCPGRRWGIPVHLNPRSGFGLMMQAFAGMCHLTGYPGDFPLRYWRNVAGFRGRHRDGVFHSRRAASSRSDRRGPVPRSLDGRDGDRDAAGSDDGLLPFNLARQRPQSAIAIRILVLDGVFPAPGDDQWIAIAIASDEELARSCEVLGVPALAQVW